MSGDAMTQTPDAFDKAKTTTKGYTFPRTYVILRLPARSSI